MTRRLQKYFMIKENRKSVFLIVIGIYFVCNIFFLEKFPFMHSDESWLSGLTRTMMNEGPGSTETFFDILPRYPHAVKSLFHLIQMPFILFMGYNLFAVRLVSLLFSCILLYLLSEFLFFLSKSITLSVLSMLVLALDVQFIYGAHFARQEIIIACGVVLIYYLIISKIKKWSIANDIKIALVIGILIGFHPNAFIAALVAGSIYIYYLLIEKEIKIYNLLTMAGLVLFFAAIYVGISYLFDPDFIGNYLNYGDHLGVRETFTEKINSIRPFYRKLFFGISGTYYTPDVKFQLILFALAYFVGIVISFKDRKILLFIFPVISVNIGYMIIGRFSQPSILFVFITSWILIFYLIAKFMRRKNGFFIPELNQNQVQELKQNQLLNPSSGSSYTLRTILIPMLILGSIIVTNLFISYSRIKPYVNNDYKDYIYKIADVIPENSKVLANLNTEFALKYDSLRDYRNLAYLQENQLSFRQYVKKNRIEYIIYPEEMDYIYYNRPVWNILYGNLYPFYDDMKEFFETECVVVDEFYSPYAMRIVKFSYDKQRVVKVYRVVE